MSRIVPVAFVHFNPYKLPNWGSCGPKKPQKWLIIAAQLPALAVPCRRPEGQ